jgi:flagellin
LNLNSLLYKFIGGIKQMRINHNIPALNAHRLLSRNNDVSAGVLERLSSGRRINKAADDAAGMAISEKMKAQVRGLKKAAQNTLDGISLIQTAEGAMNEVHSMLQRMRELAVQSANGTSTNEDRRAIQDEINQLSSEVNRIANGTEFNTRNVLRGNEAPNTNTTVHRMSTGASATFTSAVAFDLDSEVSDLGDLTSQQLSIWIDGKERVVNLNKLDGTAENATKSSLIEAFNNAMGDLGQAIFNNANQIEIRTTSIGGNSEVKITGTDEILNKLFNYDKTLTLTSTVDLPADGGDWSAITGATLIFTVDGTANNIDLTGIDTRAGLLAAINNELGADTAELDGNRLVISLDAESIAVTGTAAAAVLGTSITANAVSLKASGTPEKDTGNAQGSFYFNDLPQIGSVLTIGEEKIEFYDSRVAPYTGSNRPINLATLDGDPKEISELVGELANLGFQGVTLSRDPNVDERLIITATSTGFKGQAVFIEGTPKEFVTNLQIGPNQGQGFRLSVGDIRAQKLGISATSPEGNPGVKGAAFRSVIEITDGLSEGKIEYALDVSTEERATAAITVYDNAIIHVAGLRGALGAIQNRLEYTAANLDNTTENLTAALSRIEDADMALEMSEFTKYNILLQAGTAMLAQANQRPQSVLQLIGN